MTELKRCWRCGGMAIYVDKFGIPSETETGFVSCHWTPCMPLTEKYTVEQWQKRAIEDELEKKIAEQACRIAYLEKYIKDVENASSLFGHSREYWLQLQAYSKDQETELADLKSENDELKKAQSCDNGASTDGYFVEFPSFTYTFRSKTTVADDQGWIPVSVPPEEGKKYWATDGVIVVKAFCMHGALYDPNDGKPYFGITHYMERPGKPKPPK